MRCCTWVPLCLLKFGRPFLLIGLQEVSNTPNCCSPPMYLCRRSQLRSSPPSARKSSAADVRRLITLFAMPAYSADLISVTCRKPSSLWLPHPFKCYIRPEGVVDCSVHSAVLLRLTTSGLPPRFPATWRNACCCSAGKPVDFRWRSNLSGLTACEVTGHCSCFRCVRILLDVEAQRARAKREQAPTSFAG